ncbi:twin-arginine translocase subunit TatC [Alicyclobacillus sp. SO9]|uniref:twin-arginine translocase subunit TatC n=1 Tax=Alicyclobacillus sp. SO9 TaxID=2665646 RepID=UPI0018E753BF|nr:twin-arginine translocase subunit TatC [Alicyclobacillus sp. SO9]QQE78594.1 twin-arginine translocase subunit TatC [Alicyclobacillus sp. SO9]
MLDKMSLVGHLTDLRKRLIYVVITFVVMFAASLIFVNKIYSYLVSPVRHEHLKLMVVSPGEVITVYFMVAGFVTVGLSLPVVLYHLWKFVSPGLTLAERRYVRRLLPAMMMMFVLGVLFAWYFIFPTIFYFLVHLSQMHFNVQLRADHYFGFLVNICLPFGFIFELPIVVIFLTMIDVIRPRLMRKMRRYAYMVIIILGVFISPPELVSHLSVVTPMILLYEISILLSAVVSRRKRRQREKEEAKEREETSSSEHDE